MGRIIGIILVAIAVWYYLAGSNKRPEPEKIAYSEGRFHFTEDGRDVEIVVVSERGAEENCSSELLFGSASDLCSEEFRCSPAEFVCKNELDERYRGMLNKETAIVTYLHFEDLASGLRAVVIFWGVSQEESEKICPILIKNLEKNKDIRGIAAECI